MEDQDPGYSQTLEQELDWRDYSIGDDDATCLPLDVTTIPETVLQESDDANLLPSVSVNKFRALSVAEVSSFLSNHGIPAKFCEVFEGIINIMM